LHIYRVAEKRARVDDDRLRDALLRRAPTGLIAACKPVSFDHHSVLRARENPGASMVVVKVMEE
jgi:hypothetical protein